MSRLNDVLGEYVDYIVTAVPKVPYSVCHLFVLQALQVLIIDLSSSATILPTRVEMQNVGNVRQLSRKST